MGKLRAVGFKDSCFASVPVQPVTWRNWAEQGVDIEHLEARLRHELYQLKDQPIYLGLQMTPIIENFVSTYFNIASRQIVFHCTEAGGLNLSSPFWSYTAAELVNQWPTLGTNLKWYALVAAWLAMHDFKSGFNRHLPQLQVAGFVAICYVNKIQTSRGE